MTVDGRRAASGVGAATLLIGILLVVAPSAGERLLRLRGHANGVRIVGLADLALVPGLLVGNPRWPWMAGRGALNVVMAGYFARLAAREDAGRAKIAAAALIMLTVADSSVARRLWSQEAGS